MFLIQAIQDVLTIANILIRTGYRRFKIPAISSAILFVFAANDETLKTANAIFAVVGKKWHFLRICVRKHTIFCKENRKIAEVLDFEPIF